MAASPQKTVAPYKPGHRMTEFHIVMPMTVAEYRIGQLYTTAKLSERTATQAAEKAKKSGTAEKDGVEILINEPFENQEMGSGQYTFKIYHFQSQMPAILKKMTPAAAQIMEERCWNSYPRIKNFLNIPFFEKGSIVIETNHLEDGGETANAFNLASDNVAKRSVVVIDIAVDTMEQKDYKREEDPKFYTSTKANRGPLNDPNWMQAASPKMCVYKLVSVTFDYTGLQKKLEESVLGEQQKLFYTFHRQMFCWMDEWYSMTIDDVRAYEKEVFDRINALKGDATPAASSAPAATAGSQQAAPVFDGQSAAVDEAS